MTVSRTAYFYSSGRMPAVMGREGERRRGGRQPSVRRLVCGHLKSWWWSWRVTGLRTAATAPSAGGGPLVRGRGGGGVASGGPHTGARGVLAPFHGLLSATCIANRRGTPCPAASGTLWMCPAELRLDVPPGSPPVPLAAPRGLSPHLPLCKAPAITSRGSLGTPLPRQMPSPQTRLEGHGLRWAAARAVEKQADTSLSV